jgi:hypothetical protein
MSSLSSSSLFFIKAQVAKMRKQALFHSVKNHAATKVRCIHRKNGSTSLLLAAILHLAGPKVDHVEVIQENGDPSLSFQWLFDVHGNVVGGPHAFVGLLGCAGIFY